jgi:hypothetical protein
VQRNCDRGLCPRANDKRNGLGGTSGLPTAGKAAPAQSAADCSGAPFQLQASVRHRGCSPSPRRCGRVPRRDGRPQPTGCQTCGCKGRGRSFRLQHCWAPSPLRQDGYRLHVRMSMQNQTNPWQRQDIAHRRPHAVALVARQPQGAASEGRSTLRRPPKLGLDARSRCDNDGEPVPHSDKIDGAKLAVRPFRSASFLAGDTAAVACTRVRSRSP